MRARLTKRTIDAAKPAAKTFIIYDDTLPGFGLRVTPAGAKSFVVEYRPHGGGRKSPTKRKTIGAFGTLTAEQARQAARRTLAEARLGGDPAADRQKQRGIPTVREFIETYLEKEAIKLKPGTVANYKGYLRNHVAKQLGGLKLNAVCEQDVIRLHRAIGASKQVTANRVLEVIGSLYRYAAISGLVPKGFNPAADVQAFKEQPRERYLTTGELGRLGQALHEAATRGIPWRVDLSKPGSKHIPNKQRLTKLGPHPLAAIRLLLLTGCRLREVLHLRWSEIDWERGVALLPGSKTGRRYVVLNAPAMAVLASLERAGEYVIASDDPKKPRADLNRPWRTIAERAELGGVRLHDLRHTHASFGAGAGLGLLIIGKLLGQSQPASTARYSHLADDPLRRASERIGGTLAAALKSTLDTPQAP